MEIWLPAILCSVVKELGELFALIVKATLAKVGQSVKLFFEKFYGRDGVI